MEVEATRTESAGQQQTQQPTSPTMEGQTLEEVATLTQEDMVAFQRLCDRLHELTQSLKEEHTALQASSLKDYERLPGLKGALGLTDAVCNECAKSLSTLTSHLGDLRKGLTSVSSTLEEKLTTEGARSWVLGSEPPEIDYEKQAKQKALLAQATAARSLVGKTRTDVAVLTEKAASLEAEAAQATIDAERAAEEAEASARRAQEAREAAELKAKADEEARKKEAEAKKKREEEERKRKLEEERQQRELWKKGTTPEEEERRRKERERLDPNNWPMAVYSIDSGDLDIPIGCVVRYLPGSFKREQLEVEALNQLDDVLTLDDNEELVGHIVNLIPTSGEAELKGLEVPLAIAFPHVAPRNIHREVVVKKQMPNGQWVEMESTDVVIEDIKEFKFVEVRTRELCPMVAVTRFRRETFSLTRKGGKIAPSVDPRISLMAKPVTVRVPTDFTFEVQNVELSSVSELKQRQPDLTQNLLSCSPIVSLLAPLRKFTKPVVVSLPVPPPPHKAKPRPTTAAPSGSEKEKGSGRNIQRPSSAFFGLGHKKEEELEDTLHLLTWDANTSNWVKVPDVTFSQTKNKDVASFETQEYGLIKRFFIMRTKLDVADVQVEKVAKALEQSLKHRIVQMLLRQYAEDPQEVTLLCVPIQKSERFQRKLTEEGYGVGPPPSGDVVVHEGQKMNVTFRGNIKDCEDTTLQMVFNSHIKTNKDFSVVEIDKFAQKGINCYRGFVQVYTKGLVQQEVMKDDKRQMVMVEGDVLLTEMLVSLPKPEPEPPKALDKAPVSIKGEGLVNDKLLRHLAAEIGDEWRKLARYLNVRRVRIQAIMRNNVNKDQEDAIYDMLLTWAKKVPHSCNKVDLLCNALGYVGRVDLVEELRDREHDYKEDRAQVLRDSVLRKAFIKVAQNAHVTNDWKFLARQLNLPESDLVTIERDHGGLRERCLESLVRWREREGTLATVQLLLKHLRRCRYHHVIAQVKLVL